MAQHQLQLIGLKSSVRNILFSYFAALDFEASGVVAIDEIFLFCDVDSTPLLFKVGTEQREEKDPIERREAHRLRRRWGKGGRSLALWR